MKLSPEHFLNILRFRVTTELHAQLYQGFDGGPGDRAVIQRAARPRAGLYPKTIEEILDIGSLTRSKGAPPKKAPEAVTTALANLEIQPRQQKVSLPEIIAQALEQKGALEDHFKLVPDERGRIVPSFVDKYLSVALFEVVNDAIKVIAIWDYIVRLLKFLDSPNDKLKRSLILQELSKTYNLEYRRAQAAFQREISVGAGLTGKRFKHIANPNDPSKSKIVTKGQPTDCTVSDPQLHYILRLCHPDTNAAAAVQWIQKLDDHNARHVEDRNLLTESSVYALGDLAIIVSLIHFTSTAVTLPQMSRKNGLLLTSRIASLDAELAPYKQEADFANYLSPMDNLLESGVQASALKALADYILDRTGARFGALYEDIVEDSLGDLETLYIDAKNKAEKKENQTTHVPLPAEAPLPPVARVEQRKEKAKTRPNHPDTYDLSSAPDEQLDTADESPPPKFGVSASTAAVFTTLSSRSEARGSVAWTDFEAAMAELGFSVTPKGGSILTFHPPVSSAPRPVTLHRPHGSEIEGFKLLYIARRLQRAYRWDARTFEVK